MTRTLVLTLLKQRDVEAILNPKIEVSSEISAQVYLLSIELNVHGSQFLVWSFN